jgi:hypothetical protein
MTKTEAWIGLVEVEAVPGNARLENAVGAFVNVLALASDEAGYRALVTGVLRRCGFTVIAMTDVMRLSEWCRSAQPTSEIIALADALSEDAPVLFDEFQSYLVR